MPDNAVIPRSLIVLFVLVALLQLRNRSLESVVKRDEELIGRVREEIQGKAYELTEPKQAS